MTLNLRGRRRTLMLASLALATAPQLLAGQTPTPQQLTARYVEAIGGRTALGRLGYRHQVTEMSMPAMGMTMTVETFQARPNLFFSKSTMPGLGEVTTGYNGRVAWSNNPMQGPRVLADEELQTMLQQSDFDAMSDFARSFPTMETIGERQVDGRACWDVRMVHTSGAEVRNCFDRESGLIVASVAKQTSQMGEVEVEMLMQEYRDFDGLKVPTRIASRVMGQEMTFTVKSLSHEPIDPSVFALPAEIAALVPASN